jgi:transposase-like protein
MAKAAKKTAPKREQRGRGRPASYRPEFAEQAVKYCQLGATDFELARIFGVDTATLYRWKNTYTEFCEAVQAGKGNSDERVVRSLYNRAVGYSFESEKVFNHQGEIVRAAVIEHVPPDPGAALNWLKNRRPKEWRERKEVEHTLTLTLADLVSASYREDLPALPDPKVIEHEE